MAKSRSLCALISAIAAFASAARSDAASITYSDAVPLIASNWTRTLHVPQFDPSLGNLQQILFELAGHAEGFARFENIGNTPSPVRMHLSVGMTLAHPDLPLMTLSLPLLNSMDNATAFDGLIDFGGSSGRSYFNLSADDSYATALSAPFSPAIAQIFLGSNGNADLSSKVTGLSMVNGPGNQVAQFSASASAIFRVTYEYNPVPEPSSFALTALAGTFLLRRPRRAR